MTAPLPTLPVLPAQESPPPIWPTVLGVLSIVSGASIIVGGSWSVEIAAMTRMFDAQFGTTPLWTVCLLFFQRFLGMSCAVLAIVGGSLLAKRRPAGRVLLLIYAVAALVFLLFHPVDRFLTSAVAYPYPGMSRLGLYRGLVDMAMGLPYPIVLLVWLCRKRIRRQVRAMRHPEQRANMRPATGSAWPTVLGILVLIREAASVLGFVFFFLLRQFFMMAFVDRTAGIAFGPPWAVWFWFLLVTVVPVVPGLISGIGLVGRCRASRAATVVWATLSIVLVIFTPVAVGWLGGYGTAVGLRLLIQVAHVLTGLALPVFVLTWTLLPKTRAQMSGWRRTGGKAAT